MALDMTGSLGLSQLTQMQAQNAAQRMVDDASAKASTAQKGTSADTDGEEINEELMGACKQFEAYFMEQVFKEMEKSVTAFSKKEDSSMSTMVDFFKDMTLQQITNQAADTQSNGFAQMLYENMKNNYLAQS